VFVVVVVVVVVVAASVRCRVLDGMIGR